MRHSLAVMGAVLGVATFGAAVSAGPVVVPTYLKLSDGYVVGAIYTPFVWASVAKSGGNDGDIVRIACRDPGFPHSEIPDQPWQVTLVDAGEALSWQYPEAEHPVWIVSAPALAAQSGVAELERFTVVAAFRRQQLTNRTFVMLHRSMTVGKRSFMEFRPDRLPDLLSLRWRE